MTGNTQEVADQLLDCVKLALATYVDKCLDNAFLNLNLKETNGLDASDDIEKGEKEASEEAEGASNESFNAELEEIGSGKETGVVDLEKLGHHWCSVFKLNDRFFKAIRLLQKVR